MRVLVPKAASEQLRWQKTLAQLDVDIVWMDPWDIQLVDETPEQKTTWLNLDQFNGVVCVSPTAAKILINALDEYWPQAPVNIHWLCNGPRTAEVLKTAGLMPKFPETGYTAEDVLALPEAQAQSGDKWLIVKGEGGRVTLKEVLSAKEASVTELEVYRRGFHESVLISSAQIAEQCDALWLSSQELGEALKQAAPEGWAQWPGTVWVSSKRLQTWAEEQNFKHVACAKGATVDALSNMIKQHNLGAL